MNLPGLVSGEEHDVRPNPQNASFYERRAARRQFASRLEVVELGLDDDGDKITSCVIVPVEGLAPQKVKPKKLPAAAAKALKALHEIIDDAGIIPPPDSYIRQT
jgi:hypothetical protein